MSDDPYSLFGLRVGRVEGELKALGEKVDGMDSKLDRLLTREDERAGAEKAKGQIAASAQHRQTVVAAFGGSGATLVFQAILRKLGLIA